VLIVAATESELCGGSGLACGVGPVEAAAATARALALDPPRAVLHVGVAGGRALAPGTLVIGLEAIYVDLAARIPVVARAEPDPRLLALARAALPEAAAHRIATSGTVGGAAADVAVEAMEGFAVLRACRLAGVPAVEVRAISNELGEDDRLLWHVDLALAALGGALERLQAALARE
jgi:predicted 5'-methylthioadenosine/S-adenosylhomocysteine nucleosidase